MGESPKTPAMMRRWIAVGICVCAAAAFIPSAAPRGILALPQGVDLLSEANVRLAGGSAGDRAGVSVASAGDVNGDGVADLAVGAHYADNNGRLDSGSVYVVFGRSSLGNVDLAALGSDGFRIDGAAAGDGAGYAVASADVNGDQLSDVILGAPTADSNGVLDTGAVYVVYGKVSPGNVDLATASQGDDNGFRIVGAAAGDEAGISVGAAGDLTGDGRSELLLGASGADNRGRIDSGSAYVVFGAPSSGGFNLSLIGAYGFQIDGAVAGDRAGSAVAGGGDVNGDGNLDLVVGAPFADDNARADSGSVYVVYGKPSMANVDLAALGPGLFRVTGEGGGDLAGISVAVGEVTGDSRSEVIIGAPYADNNGRKDSGSAYVVFGIVSSSGFDLSLIGAYGFRIDGGAAGDASGFEVAGGGDLNGDGLGDIAVGAWGSDSNARDKSGSVDVVFGRPFSFSGPVDLATLGPGGFHIAGAAAGDEAGTRVADLGDVNGDSHPDLIIGAPKADGVGADSGAAYVIYGYKTPDSTAPGLVLGGRLTQRLLVRKGITVRATCDEPCTLAATGSVAILGTRSVFGLKRATGNLNAPGSSSLELGFGTAAQRRFRRLWAPGTKAEATIIVQAVDAAGNLTAARRTVMIRR